jgi:uncharacterized phage-associated protein
MPRCRFLQYLYREFKPFGSAPIKERAQRVNPHTGQDEVVAYAFDEPTLELLRRVVGFYCRLDAGTLVELTLRCSRIVRRVIWRGWTPPH